MTNTINLPQPELKMLREILYFLRPSEERQVWLVGGSIRDLLRGFKSLPDLDLTTSFNPLSAAREYARKTGAGFVVLDEERQVVRVVRTYNDEHYTFDISRFRAENIDEDLRARDFTINAIAAPLYLPGDSEKAVGDLLQTDGGSGSGELALYDPLEGREHLRQGLIIPCSDSLFTDDPLRLMRAFRFSAIFNANFSPQLHRMIVNQASLLSGVSGERIRDELFKVLQVDNSTHWVRIMHETGILKVIFPQLAICEGVEQNEWHHLDVFEHSVLTLENLEKALLIQDRPEWWPMFTKYLNENLSGNRSYLQLLKLGCLLHDLGKPYCKRIDNDSGKVIFHGHEMEGVRIARSICESLRLSVNESNYLQLLVKNHMRPGVMLQQGITDKRLFRFFSETGRDGLGIALLSLADRYSAQGSLSTDELAEFELGIMSIMQVFYEQMKKPKLAPFLNGNDLITLFNLKPGPDFKRILDILEEAQFLGEVTSREEAMIKVSELLAT
ncbi:MAG: HD domain-containing protein [Candidatus Riflebacteria bacterium]|nr:HD domain-containing protein [Candidatus Riflebacteria bacterium]